VLLRLFLICACVGLAACDGDATPSAPSPSPSPSPGVEQISGTERIGWDQQAASAAELATFRYNIYVDGTAAELQNVSCAGSQGSAGFACSARLPQMTPGRHTLGLTAFIEAGGRLESARSATLTVNLAAQGITSGAPPPMLPQLTSLTTMDGALLQATVLAVGLEEATAMAAAPDGRIFIAERAGRIRVFRDGRLQPAPAALIDDVLATERRGLLALAVPPASSGETHLYAVYTTAGGFQAARFRAVGDTLGDRAVVVDGIEAPLARPAASLRFGPDGKLYIGLDDAGDLRRSDDVGSYNGKVLRLNPDGTTPSDQAGATPVFVAGLTSPRGFDWSAAGAMWIADDSRTGEELRVVVSTAVAARRGDAVARYRLPAGTGAAGVTFYRSAVIPELNGNLLVASAEAAGILRLVIDAASPHRLVASERLLTGAFGSIRAISVGSDGFIYLTTDRALVRIAPQPVP
jgi:glucose/arabinose dehydrogenase